MNGKHIEKLEEQLKEDQVNCTNCKKLFEEMLASLKQAYFEIDQLTAYIHGRDR